MAFSPSVRHSLSHPIILGFFLFCLLCCDAPKSPAEATAPSSATETDTLSAARKLNMMGDSAVSLGNYPVAIAYYQRSMDSAAVYADSFPYYDSMLDIACVHDRLSELDKAIEIAKPVIEAYIRSQDSARIGRGYTTLSAFYGRANQFENQIITAKKGLEIVKKHGSLIECCAAYNQIAFTYTDQKRWAEALPMLDSALLYVELAQRPEILTSIYLNLGNCYRNLQRWEPAQFYLQKCANLADSLQQTHIKAVATLRRAQVAEAQGDFGSALRLFKESAALKDSVLNQKKIEQIQTLEVSYETKEKELLINTLKLEQKATQSERNLMYALAFLALTILGFALLQARQNLKRTQSVLAQNQQELRTYATVLNTKNAQLLKLENALQAAQPPTLSPENLEKKENPDTDANGEDPESLFNSQILTFEDWEIFKHRFEQAYPGYLFRLRKNVPALTSAEERLFLLLKLRFSSQEIADTLGISINGVKKGRQRLRKRLNLQAEEDLDQHILGVD